MISYKNIEQFNPLNYKHQTFASIKLQIKLEKLITLVSLSYIIILLEKFKVYYVCNLK